MRYQYLRKPKHPSSCLTILAAIVMLLTTLIMTITVSINVPVVESHSNTVNSTRAGEDEITLTNLKLTPKSGDDYTTFMFIITVISNEKPEENIEVILNGKPFQMEEIYNEDQEYSDGKDFHYSSKLGAGATIYYFRCGNTTTSAYTVSVEEFNRWGMHYDIALLLALFIIPFVLIVTMIRRIETDSDEWSRSLEKLGKKLGKRRH